MHRIADERRALDAHVSPRLPDVNSQFQEFAVDPRVDPSVLAFDSFRISARTSAGTVGRSMRRRLFHPRRYLDIEAVDDPEFLFVGARRS